MKESFKKTLVMSRLKWAGYVKNDKRIRYPQNGGKREAKKIENATGGLREERHGKNAGVEITPKFLVVSRTT